MKTGVNKIFGKILITAIFLIVFQSSGFGQNVQPVQYLIDVVKQDSVETGWLELISERPIKKVWIDSLEIPFNRNSFIKLETGFHTLQVRAQNPANWFIKDVIDTIEIIANDTLQLTLSFPEFKMLYSDPYGANIFIGGNLLGKTPFLINREILTGNQITLSRFGYQDTTLAAVDQFFPTVWVTMEQDQNAQNKTIQKIQLKIAREKRQRNKALLTFGLGLVSGAAAYLTKREADRNYDRYLIAGNPTEINRLYHLTKRYDRIAAGSYIVFELNMLASAYFFFKYLVNR